MGLAYVGGVAKSAAPTAAPAAARQTFRTVSKRPSPGVNVQPGSADDGWLSPPPVTLSDGSEVQLFKDGEGLAAAYRAIQSAQRYIALEVYIFASDETGRAFADLLSQKARQGVRVYVIYDSFGSINSDRAMFKRMRQSGVRVQAFHPIRPWECLFSWRPFNRDHRKLLVIDDHIAGLGGLNIGNEYAGPWIVPVDVAGCELWRDNAIGIVGPSAILFRQSFGKTWGYISRGGRIRRAEMIHNLHEGELGVMALVPTLNSPLRPFLYRLLREARESILMTMAYFAPDDPLIEGLCKAAQRGVRVRLMLPGHCDVPAVRLCGRSFYELLLSAGVEIYERQGVILHAKTMVVDQHTSIIGSTNLDYRSIEYNCELSAIVRSGQFGKQMHELFANDVKFSDQIRLGEWRRRPHWDRFVHWAVSRARYLL